MLAVDASQAPEYATRKNKRPVSMHGHFTHTGACGNGVGERITQRVTHTAGGAGVGLAAGSVGAR